MLITTRRCAKALQLTLAVIKPDAVAHPVILEALHQRILENNFIIVRSKDLVWRRQDSEKFYSEHAGKVLDGSTVKLERIVMGSIRNMQVHFISYIWFYHRKHISFIFESLHTLRLKSLKLIFQPLHKFLVN
ncbi:unnamed protein product [Oncorhynchus mykiss]|uniref:Nucleoside diphosphate kinase-like domain-containing protein n=1 Tax=Oncorhynchus mykiss TaxID=8022 RepID=A0A060YIQ6_ONCMY|nr:unnamed protein product [Oncorhynchus mykiss]